MMHIAQVTVECMIHEEQSALKGQQGGIGPIRHKITRAFCAHGPSFEAALSECLAKATSYVKAESVLLAAERRD